MVGFKYSSLVSVLVHRPRFYLLVLVLAGLLVGVGLNWWLRDPLPQPGPLPHVNDHQVEQALQESRQKVLDNPGGGPAWGELGMVLWANDFPGEALTHFRRAEQLDAIEPRWPYFQALILLDLDPGQGLAKLRRTCELDPRSLTPRLRLAQALFAQGQWQQAEGLLATLLGERPDHGHVLLLAGRLSLSQDKLDNARDHLLQAIQDPATAKVAYQLLSQAWQRLGQKAQADKSLAQASRMPEGSNLPDPYWEEAKAKQTGKRALSIRIDQLQAENKVASVIELAEVLVREYPGDARGHFMLGYNRLKYLAQLKTSAHRLELLGDARAALDQALRLDPENAEFLLARAYCAFAEQTDAGFRDAIRRAEQAALLGPKDVKIFLGMGQMHLKKNEWELAIAAWQRGLKAAPDADELHDQLAQVYFTQGQFPSAMVHLTKKKSHNLYVNRYFMLQKNFACW